MMLVISRCSKFDVRADYARICGESDAGPQTRRCCQIDVASMIRHFVHSQRHGFVVLVAPCSSRGQVHRHTDPKTHCFTPPQGSQHSHLSSPVRDSDSRKRSTALKDLFKLVTRLVLRSSDQSPPSGQTPTPHFLPPPTALNVQISLLDSSHADEVTPLHQPPSTTPSLHAHNAEHAQRRQALGHGRH